jgi:hypothetical protein
VKTGMRRNGSGVSTGQLALPLYVEGLKPGARVGCAPPAELKRLAASVLDQVPGCGMSADDLVSELTVRLLERSRRGQDPLGEGVSELRGVLRYRLWQIACEHAPSRKLLKELTAHVRRALQEPLPATAPRPLALERNGRLQHTAVAQGVAWAVGEQDAPGAPRALARWLAKEFDLLAVPTPLEEARAVAAPELPVVGALRLAQRLAARLGREKVTLLQLRLGGASFEELGQALGGSTTRAFERLREIQADVSEEERALSAPEPQLRAALQLFTQAPRRSTGSDEGARGPTTAG